MVPGSFLPKESSICLFLRFRVAAMVERTKQGLDSPQLALEGAEAENSPRKNMVSMLGCAGFHCRNLSTQSSKRG